MWCLVGAGWLARMLDGERVESFVAVHNAILQLLKVPILAPATAVFSATADSDPLLLHLPILLLSAAQSGSSHIGCASASASRFAALCSKEAARMRAASLLHLDISYL